MRDINLLLTEIFKINKRYEKQAKLSGENFNVFSIMRLSEDEISHSRIIAHLLNPKGAHEQGYIFLKHFLDEVKEEINRKDDISELSEARAQTEKYIGEINKDFTSGGRIDIAISEKNKTKIMIENKIYASDQEKQLLRYHNHEKNALLLYLTLDGKDATPYSLGEPENKVQYYRISYKKTILNWLEKCKRDAVDKPFIRETLSQYIIIIKNLTGQPRSKEMKEELFKTIVDTEMSLKAAMQIVNTIESLKKNLLKEFVQKFIEFFKEKAREKDLKIIICFEDFNNIKKSDSDIDLFSIENPNNPGLMLLFAIRGAYGLIYGLTTGINKEVENQSAEFNNLKHDFPELDKGPTKNFIKYKECRIKFNELPDETISKINLKNIDKTINDIYEESIKILNKRKLIPIL